MLRILDKSIWKAIFLLTFGYLKFLKRDAKKRIVIKSFYRYVFPPFSPVILSLHFPSRKTFLIYFIKYIFTLSATRIRNFDL